MDKKIILGFIIGFGAFYAYENFVKKPCGCKKTLVESDEDLAEPNPSNIKSTKEPSCEDAVNMVMNDLRKSGAKMTEAGFQQRRKLELAKCQKMSM